MKIATTVTAAAAVVTTQGPAADSRCGATVCRHGARCVTDHHHQGLRHRCVCQFSCDAVRYIDTQTTFQRTQCRLACSVCCLPVVSPHVSVFVVLQSYSRYMEHFFSRYLQFSFSYAVFVANSEYCSANQLFFFFFLSTRLHLRFNGLTVDIAEYLLTYFLTFLQTKSKNGVLLPVMNCPQT